MANLRDMARDDLAVTLEDDVNGFGVPVAVTNPDGVTDNLVGQTGDIHLAIDPDTGLTVSGRTAHVSLGIAAIETAFGAGAMPQGQVDTTKKPWKFVFADPQGTARAFIVREALPDRTLGLVTCTLEAYVE